MKPTLHKNCWEIRSESGGGGLPGIQVGQAADKDTQRVRIVPAQRKTGTDDAMARAQRLKAKNFKA